MNGRALIPVAGLALILFALWLFVGEDEPPATADGGDTLAAPADPPQTDSTLGGSSGAPSQESASAPPPPSAPRTPRDGGGDAGASEGAARAADDDDSAAIDPADRTDADPTLVFSPDREGIQGAVNESLPQIKDCYQSWLQVRPDLSGRVMVQFVIAGDAEDPDFSEIRDVTLKDSELGHTLMEGCVASLFEELQFEAPDGGGEVAVNYPLKFTTE